MRGIKFLFGTTALLAGLALAPAARSQVVINIGVQPSCAYGYYDYAPYSLLALWLLRAGVLLQRHLSGHGPMGRLGLRPRLGRPSLQRGWWRTLSRRRGRGGQSQQLCPRRRRPSRRGASQAGRSSNGARTNAPRVDPGPSFSRTGFSTQRQLRTQLPAAVVVDIKAAAAAVDIKVVAAVESGGGGGHEGGGH